MKAKIIETEEIIDGFQHTNKNGVIDYFITSDGRNIPIEEINFTNIDWEQRRYEIAKAVLQGIWANSNTTICRFINSYVELAIKQADALIAELKKK